MYISNLRGLVVTLLVTFRCTCQLSAPRDVCHQQFGAEPAFKLIWCRGSTLAIAVTDSGEVSLVFYLCI